jgi:hypothetical protein
MTVKVDLLIDVSPHYISIHENERENIPQIILNDIIASIEFDGKLKIIAAKADE